MFNPFDKQINELELSDLELLRDRGIAEGYWVEYKSEMPQPLKTARTVASFANMYGGWLFIGITADRTTNIPTAFPGVDHREHADPISTVRDSIKAHVDPVPLFTAALIEVSEHRSILALRVQEEQEPPHLTSDGQIYRREGDSSEPVPETDRFALDKLIDRGKKSVERFAQFCADDRLIGGPDPTSWLRLYFQWHLPDDLRPQHEIREEIYLKELLSKADDQMQVNLPSGEYVTGNIPLDFIMTTERSIVLRQLAGLDPAVNTLELELFDNGSCKIHVPLQTIEMPKLGQVPEHGSTRARNILRELNDPFSEFPDLTIIDVSKLWFLTALCVTFYETWFIETFGEDSRENYPCRAAVAIEGSSLSVPFIDDDRWAEHVREFGLPVVMRDQILIPSDMARAWLHDEILEHQLWFLPCTRSALALGLTLELVSAVAFSWDQADSAYESKT